MGGAVGRVPDDATAFGGRSARFQTLLIGIHPDDEPREPTVNWSRSFWSALEPHAHGAYVNLSDDQDERMLRTTYGAGKYARLQRIKAEYDPDNVFRLNQNIRPLREPLPA
jgi:FAD/FMN-containing dehydrogenase